MADIVFVLIALAFFGVCVLYVRACDRLVRAGEDRPEGAEAGAGRAAEAGSGGAAEVRP